jgi:hypothetical protein
MFEGRRWARWVLAVALVGAGWMLPAAHAQAPAANRQLGTVKSVAANSVALTTDAGQAVSIQVDGDTKILKLPAGSKDMKDAQEIALKDVAVGDRLLVRGKPGDAAGTFVASTVIVMKAEDLQQKHQQEEQDWQKRGTGGLVKQVDAAAQTITISAGGQGVAAKTTVIHVSATTVLRRYAPDSVKFEDAQVGTLAQIQPGDQLRARGTRTADGDLNAEEIVSGSFRNVAGTVVKMDAASGVLVVKDAATQKPVTLKLTADSQLRRLPAQAAQMMAARMSGGGAGAPGGAAPPAGGMQGAPMGGPPSGGPPMGGPPSGGAPGGGARGAGAGRGDLSQMMGRLPKMPEEDLKAGDTVMIVATPGAANGQGTVITLLAGVEAILAATPKGAAPMTLSPWNINGSPGESAGTP